MKKSVLVGVLSVSFLLATKGFCSPLVPTLLESIHKTQNPLVDRKIERQLSPATLKIIRTLRVGMRIIDVAELGLFVPEAGKRPGWTTLQFGGRLLPAEVKKLEGRVIKIDVQIVQHPGPISVFNPPNGCINPTTYDERIATVSAPYLEIAGPVRLD